MQLIINRVSVERLFGFLNYDLKFPQSEQLIITGPNGYGKTMLLKLIHHAISNDYAELANINFKSFDLFTNIGHVRYLNTKGGIQVESFLHETKKIITHTIQHQSKEPIFDYSKFRSILINSVRLNNESESDNIIAKQRSYLSERMTYAKENVRQLDSLVDDLFSSITINRGAGCNEYLPEMIQERIIGLQELLSPYVNFGLMPLYSKYLDLDLSKSRCSPTLVENLNETLGEIFYEESLHHDFIGRVCMFSRLIEEKSFAFKTLSITPEIGFSFSNYADKNIPLESLSSGEKNQVSIFFDLIFNAKDGTLILIDEPEISLHISWQKSLLSEFSQITKFNNYSQLIVATHSPDVISGEWDISVDLYDKHEIVAEK
ncbi:TPA: AAA family ATPase [Vibrio cholerae]|uniref:AAA family ATPase n=1 Tax=Vibrio cholerae TaxID=666 RepID=UPI00155EA85B|nr:AAA family ATPase [Vibrio cholerae]NOE11083.1 AAA family ATPase [Vibrio cholerae]NOF32778.1 AAA family ATPase [Vibrio cholerae]HDZ3718059.1 AAA family ATPase [Vibrio cholerae]